MPTLIHNPTPEQEQYIRESLYLDPASTFDPASTSASTPVLRWRSDRPLHHFKSSGFQRRTNNRYGGRVAGTLERMPDDTVDPEQFNPRRVVGLMGENYLAETCIDVLRRGAPAHTHAPTPDDVADQPWW